MQRENILRNGLLALWALIIVAGFAVRMYATKGEMWLDEILSLNLARSVTMPWGILVAKEAHTDNNHLLNTFVLYILRDQRLLPFDRLHSVLAGTGTILLALRFARRWGNAAATCAAVATASAFILIHYSSEARGYSMLVFFTLLAILAIEAGLSEPRVISATIFGIACVLGLLAHLLFVQAYIACLAWSVWRVFHTGPLRKDAAFFFLQYHGAPLAAIGVLYVWSTQYMMILGAPVSPLSEVLADTAAFSVGISPSGWSSYLALGVLTVILVAGIGVLWWRRDDVWLLLFMLCFGAPTLVMLATKPEFTMPRYFILPVMGALLVLSCLLGHLFDMSGAGRTVAIASLALFVAGNSRFTVELLRNGRGHYLDALRYIAVHSSSMPVRISSDHDFRHRTVVDFYVPILAHRGFQYVDRNIAANAPTDWMLIHSFDPRSSPSQTRDDFGQVYRLEASYQSGPLAGWSLYAYRRIP